MGGLDTFMAGAKSIWPAKLIKSGAQHVRLIGIGLLGICLLLAGSIFDFSPAKPKDESLPKASRTPLATLSYEEALEAKLANLLSQVKGAGSVAVSITLESGSVQEHARNVVKETKTIQEKDTSGGTRSTIETKESEQILLTKENGIDRPVMVREIKPAIKGVLVIADGAYDSAVKASLTKAIEAGLGIPSYRITVLPQRK